MKGHFVLLLFGSFVLFQCQSRDFKSVPIEDKVSSEMSVEKRQSLEEARALLTKGNLSFQKSNFSEAISLAKEANLKIETAEGYALLGASEYQLSDYASAKSAYQLGERLDPKNEKILIGLGTVQGTLGEYAEATSTYQKLSELEPDEPVYKYKVGTLLKLQRKYDESYVTLKPLTEISNFPFPVELLNQLGDVCLELKKYPEAEMYFARAEELQPDLKSAKNAKLATRVAALIAKGNDAIASKNYDLAISEYKKASDLQPLNASIFTFLGNAYFLKNEFPEAENQFQKSIKLQDNFTNAYLGLCNVFIKKNQFNDCLKVSEEGLRKSPRNAELKNKLGICQWKWGQTQKAVLSFQDSASWDKNFFEPRINLAYLLLDQGRNAEAIEALKDAEKHIHADKEQIKKALALAESQMFIVEGDTFLRQGKRKAALEMYGKALGRSPNDPAPHNAFGKAYFAFNEYKKSESSFLEALRNDANNLMAMQGLARLYAKTGESKKESEYVGRLDKLSKSDPFAAITMGRIAEDAGKYDEAESIYLGLGKKFPNHEAIQFRLASLYYKRAVDENEKENYTKASEYVQKSKKLSNEIPEVIDTERTINENIRFAEIIPFVREGNKAFDKKKYDDAIVSYQKAYNKIQKPSLLVKIAECYMGKGEEEKGLSILEKAARENKDQASSFQEGIYAFFYKKGELTKAEEGFTKLLLEKPDSFYSYYMLGLISMKKREYESSINYFDRAVLLNGAFAPANVAKGLSLYKTGNADLAKREFEKAKDKDKSFSLSSYNLAIAYFNEDLLSESKVVLEELRKSDPDFSEGEIHLSYIYFKEGKLDEAESVITNVLKSERSAEALYAHFIILSEKQKKSPTEKTKSKLVSLQKEIWQNYPETKYARLLPTENKDEEIVITELQLSGSPIEIPILYPNRLIVNYGESIVGFERETKETVWKIFTPNRFDFLLASKQILAVRSGQIQKIYPDTGKFGTMIPLTEGETILKADVQDERLYLLTADSKTNVKKLAILTLDGEPIKTVSDPELLSFGKTTTGKILVAKEKKGEFLLHVYNDDSMADTPKPITITKKDRGETLSIIACLKESCLVRIGSLLAEVNSTGKLVSLPSKGSYVTSYLMDDSVQVKTSNQLLVWTEGGKWADVYTSESDFRYPISDAIIEAKKKEIQIIKGSSKKSYPWNPEKDNKRLSTITLD
ncbi:MAG: tetratricopeptide repeat protein [Leptospira sp.]|nr:tetratricopeptide repeat protein [Leptospira sp.]